MSSWILQLNPNVYRSFENVTIPDYLTGQDDWWGISSYFNIIESGEDAYLWQAIAHRPGVKNIS